MEPPAFAAGPSATVRAAPGSAACLLLPLPTGTPPFRYHWSRGGAALDDRFTVSDDAGGVRLTVSAAQTGDSGVYTLQASNAAGSDTSRVRLEVSAEEAPTGDDPPTFLRRLQDLTVKVGTRTRFLVEIVSSTECKVTWYRNERRLLEAERVSLVRDGNFWCADVAAVSVDDAGRWTCTAENEGGRASCSAHLNVLVPKAYKRPEFVEELRALLTEQGTVSLECKVVGVPTPVLRWFKDSCEIKAGDVFALTANADDPTSLGTYTCEAVNCMGRAYSSSKVHVVGRSRESSTRPSSSGVTPEPPPIFTKELEDHSVKICDPLTLACHVVVPPWPRSVIWYNKEGKVEPGERYHVLEDGAGGYLLEVPSTEWADEGEWKCVATSAGGRVGISTCFVAMEVPKNYRKPRFMENLQAVLTEEGLVSFECKVVGFPTPVLSWFKDGQELKPGDVYQLTGTNSLGSYCCIAKNCMGQASSSAELTVEDIQNQLNEEEKLQLFSKNQAPKFLQGLKSVEAKIDEPFRFTVKVAIPPEPSVLWYRDEQPVDESTRCHLGKEDRGGFFIDIQTLEFLDQAEWKCVAINDFGHSVTSCFLKLIIPRHYKKPRFLENLQAILSEEGAVNLECKVIGVPQPVLKWYKDGEELKPGDIHRIISGQDGTCCLGTYTCEAQNCMGIAASSASLLGFDDSIKAKTKKAEEQALQRNLSLSTIHEERTSQMYDTPVGDITLDDKGEISFSFDGKEVSVSLYETPDLTEEEALQIVEMYADQLSENVTEHNVVELPPLRFVKETSTSGNLLMEAIIIDVSPDYFASPEEDLRTEADVEDISIADENGPPQLSLDQDFDIGGEDYLEKTMALLSEDKSDIPAKLGRKKSDSQKSVDDFYSLSRDQSLSEGKKDDDTHISESDPVSYESARSSAKIKSKSSKPSLADGLESSEPTKTIVYKDETTNVAKEEISRELESISQDQQNREVPEIKTKRERRFSRSSRRSSSGSEKSTSKSREELLRLKSDIEEISKNLTMTNKEFKTTLGTISDSLTKVLSEVQLIERDIILKSELMSSAATASRSLEIISNLISPLSEIHSIIDTAKESTTESKEIVSAIFQNIQPPLKVLHQYLTIIEKCIDMESDNKTLVKKTCVAFIEICGSDLAKIISEITSVTSKDYLQIENKIMNEIDSLASEMISVLKFSADTITARNLLSEANEINPEEQSLEETHLRDTQKVIFELKIPVNSLLKIVKSAESGNMIELTKIKYSDVLLNDMSASIQDLQIALEQIETLSMSESSSILQKYNTEIIEAVVEPVLKLRSAFEQLSMETNTEEDTHMLRIVLSAIKENLTELSSQISLIETKVGQFDVLQNDNKLNVLQRMAQILIALENSLPRLETMSEVQPHMNAFHKNLTKVLEIVIESNDSKKYFALMEICDAVNRINTSVRLVDADNALALASLCHTFKIVQDQFVNNVFESELNCSIITNITDILVGIQEAINKAEDQSIQIQSEHIEDFTTSIPSKAKVSIVMTHIDQTIAAIDLIKTLDTAQELKLVISPTLESICPILDDLKKSVAAIRLNNIEQDENLIDLSIEVITQTLASPLYELNQNIIVLNQLLMENIESLKLNSDVLTAIAEPLHELHTTLETLQQDVISQYGDDLTPYEINVNIASAAQNLHSCIVMIEEQTGVEVVDDISTLEDISNIKTSADPLPSDRLVLPTVEFTEVEQSVPPLTEELPTSATVQVLQSLNEHLEIMQTPEVLDALDTLSEISDFSSLKSVVLGVQDLHNSIENILHPVPIEASNDLANMVNMTSLAIIAQPLQEFQQNLSVLDTTHIPIYEDILDLPTERVQSIMQSIFEFKQYLAKCTQAVFPAMDLLDDTFEISTKVSALREVCSHLKNVIETAKVTPHDTKCSKIKKLEEVVDTLFEVTNVSVGIKVDEIKCITEKLYEKVVEVQEEMIEFTSQPFEKLSQEAKLIQITGEVERNIAVLQQYDFVDLSRISDISSCPSLQVVLEIESEPLAHIDDVVENAVNIVQDSIKETPIADLMIVEDFFKTCKIEFTILKCLITKTSSHKKIIRLLEEFNSLKTIINDFKTKRFDLKLSNDVNDCLTTFIMHADNCIKDMLTALIKILESQSDMLVKTPIAKLNSIQTLIEMNKKHNKDTVLDSVIEKYTEIVEKSKPVMNNIHIEIIDELKQSSVAEVNLEEKILTEKIEELKDFIDTQSNLPTIDNATKQVLQNVSGCIHKHGNYKDASSKGKTLIILKCLSDCIDILRVTVLGKQKDTDKQTIQENQSTLKEVLTEMLQPLQALQTQLVSIREQVLSGAEEDSISFDIASTESLVQTMTELHEDIVHHIESDKTAVNNDDISLIMELDKEIHCIQNSLKSMENIEAAQAVKEVTKPMESIEKCLHDVLIHEKEIQTEQEISKAKSEHLSEHIDQYLELIEIVEEISAVIKIDDVKDTFEIAHKLKESIAVSDITTEGEQISQINNETQLKQATLIEKLQKALCILQVQVKDNALELAPVLSDDVVQKITHVTAQLQVDLSAVTGIQTVVEVPLSKSEADKSAESIETPKVKITAPETISVTTAEFSVSKPVTLKDESTSEASQDVALLEILGTTLETQQKILQERKSNVNEIYVNYPESTKTETCEPVIKRGLEVGELENPEKLSALEIEAVEELSSQADLVVSPMKEENQTSSFETVIHESETNITKQNEQQVHKLMFEAIKDKMIHEIEELISVDISEVINDLSSAIDVEELKNAITTAKAFRDTAVKTTSSESIGEFEQKVSVHQAKLIQHLQNAVLLLQEQTVENLQELMPTASKCKLDRITVIANDLCTDLIAIKNICEQPNQSCDQLRRDSSTEMETQNVMLTNQQLKEKETLQSTTELAISSNAEDVRQSAHGINTLAIDTTKSTEELSTTDKENENSTDKSKQISNLETKLSQERQQAEETVCETLSKEQVIESAKFEEINKIMSSQASFESNAKQLAIEFDEGVVLQKTSEHFTTAEISENENETESYVPNISEQIQESVCAENSSVTIEELKQNRDEDAMKDVALSEKLTHVISDHDDKKEAQSATELSKTESLASAEPYKLIQHIDEFIADEISEFVQEISNLTNVNTLKESVSIAKSLRECILGIDNSAAAEGTSPLPQSKLVEEVQLSIKLQNALSTLHTQALDSAQDIAPTIKPELLEKVSEIITHLQEDLSNTVDLTLYETIQSIGTLDAKSDQNTMTQLVNLLQEVNDSFIFSTLENNTDYTETLKDTLDEVQTVIMKLKRDYDSAANDTLNETLEDLECSVRSVQLQINEDSPPALLKEACETLLLLANNIKITQELQISKNVSKSHLTEMLLEKCSNETAETLKLLEVSSTLELKESNSVGNIIPKLNNLTDTLKSLRKNFLSNADTLIENGVEVMQCLRELEDQVFAIERDLDAEVTLSPSIRDNIITAVHSVYGSISNMRSAISSIQKRYLFENYGQPSASLLQSIKNVTLIISLDDDLNKPDWKKFSKSIRNVLNHFEDIKFYINLDKTARVPSDATFTKIILDELKTNISKVLTSHKMRLGTETLKKICDAIQCVDKYLIIIDEHTSLEVKNKIPMFKEIASEVLNITNDLKITQQQQIDFIEKPLAINKDTNEIKQIKEITYIVKAEENLNKKQSESISEESIVGTKLSIEQKHDVESPIEKNNTGPLETSETSSTIVKQTTLEALIPEVSTEVAFIVKQESPNATAISHSFEEKELYEAEISTVMTEVQSMTDEKEAGAIESVSQKQEILIYNRKENNGSDQSTLETENESKEKENLQILKKDNLLLEKETAESEVLEKEDQLKVQEENLEKLNVSLKLKHEDSIEIENGQPVDSNQESNVEQILKSKSNEFQQDADNEVPTMLDIIQKQASETKSELDSMNDHKITEGNIEKVELIQAKDRQVQAESEKKLENESIDKFDAILLDQAMKPLGEDAELQEAAKKVETDHKQQEIDENDSKHKCVESEVETILEEKTDLEAVIDKSIGFDQETNVETVKQGLDFKQPVDAYQVVKDTNEANQQEPDQVKLNSESEFKRKTEEPEADLNSETETAQNKNVAKHEDEKSDNKDIDKNIQVQLIKSENLIETETVTKENIDQITKESESEKTKLSEVDCVNTELKNKQETETGKIDDISLLQLKEKIELINEQPKENTIEVKFEKDDENLKVETATQPANDVDNSEKKVKLKISDENVREDRTHGVKNIVKVDSVELKQKESEISRQEEDYACLQKAIIVTENINLPVKEAESKDQEEKYIKHEELDKENAIDTVNRDITLRHKADADFNKKIKCEENIESKSNIDFVESIEPTQTSKEEMNIVLDKDLKDNECKRNDEINKQNELTIDAIIEQKAENQNSKSDVKFIDKAKSEPNEANKLKQLQTDEAEQNVLIQKVATSATPKDYETNEEGSCHSLEVDVENKKIFVEEIERQEIDVANKETENNKAAKSSNVKEGREIEKFEEETEINQSETKKDKANANSHEIKQYSITLHINKEEQSLKKDEDVELLTQQELETGNEKQEIQTKEMEKVEKTENKFVKIKETNSAEDKGKRIQEDVKQLEKSFEIPEYNDFKPNEKKEIPKDDAMLDEVKPNDDIEKDKIIKDIIVQKEHKNTYEKQKDNIDASMTKTDMKSEDEFRKRTDLNQNVEVESEDYKNARKLNKEAIKTEKITKVEGNDRNNTTPHEVKKPEDEVARKQLTGAGHLKNKEDANNEKGNKANEHGGEIAQKEIGEISGKFDIKQNYLTDKTEEPNVFAVIKEITEVQEVDKEINIAKKECAEEIELKYKRKDESHVKDCGSSDIDEKTERKIDIQKKDKENKEDSNKRKSEIKQSENNNRPETICELKHENDKDKSHIMNEKDDKIGVEEDEIVQNEAISKSKSRKEIKPEIAGNEIEIVKIEEVENKKKESNMRRKSGAEKSIEHVDSKQKEENEKIGPQQKTENKIIEEMTARNDINKTEKTRNELENKQIQDIEDANKYNDLKQETECERTDIKQSEEFKKEPETKEKLEDKKVEKGFETKQKEVKKEAETNQKLEEKEPDKKVKTKQEEKFKIKNKQKQDIDLKQETEYERTDIKQKEEVKKEPEIKEKLEDKKAEKGFETKQEEVKKEAETNQKLEEKEPDKKVETKQEEKVKIANKQKQDIEDANKYIDLQQETEYERIDIKQKEEVKKEPETKEKLEDKKAEKGFETKQEEIKKEAETNQKLKEKEPDKKVETKQEEKVKIANKQKQDIEEANKYIDLQQEIEYERTDIKQKEEVKKEPETKEKLEDKKAEKGFETKQEEVKIEAETNQKLEEKEPDKKVETKHEEKVKIAKNKKVTKLHQEDKKRKMSSDFEEKKNPEQVMNKIENEQNEEVQGTKKETDFTQKFDDENSSDSTEFNKNEKAENVKTELQSKAKQDIENEQKEPGLQHKIEDDRMNIKSETKQNKGDKKPGKDLELKNKEEIENVTKEYEITQKEEVEKAKKKAEAKKQQKDKKLKKDSLFKENTKAENTENEHIKKQSQEIEELEEKYSKTNLTEETENAIKDIKIRKNKDVEEANKQAEVKQKLKGEIAIEDFVLIEEQKPGKTNNKIERIQKEEVERENNEFRIKDEGEKDTFKREENKKCEEETLLKENRNADKLEEESGLQQIKKSTLDNRKTTSKTKKEIGKAKKTSESKLDKEALSNCEADITEEMKCLQKEKSEIYSNFKQIEESDSNNKNVETQEYKTLKAKIELTHMEKLRIDSLTESPVITKDVCDESENTLEEIKEAEIKDKLLGQQHFIKKGFDPLFVVVDDTTKTIQHETELDEHCVKNNGSIEYNQSRCNSSDFKQSSLRSVCSPDQHYSKEFQFEPSSNKMNEFRKEKYSFVDHNHRNYEIEFDRPTSYRERSFDVDRATESQSIYDLGKNVTIYKAQTLVLDAQLRSPVSPYLDISRSSESSHRKPETRQRSKALSEARSLVSDKKSISRDSKRKPVFSTYLTDRTAVEGSRVKLTCSVLCSTDPAVTWYKNGVLLDNNLKYRTKYVDGLITLEVLNAIPSDSAEYSCTVENENGSVSSSANLKVFPSFEASPIPPTFTRSIRDTYHSAENELVLECRIRGQPLPTITWLKDDRPVISNERFQAYYLADGVCRLAIESPTPDDSGKYTCKAENSVWSDQITHVVTFTGKSSRLSPNIATLEKSRFNRQAMESRRPHFTNVLTDYKVAKGGTIGLQVEVKGAPTSVEWLREGRSVTEVYRNARTFVEQGLYTLALSDVTEKESGMYTCRAWSAHGNVDMNAAITVVQSNDLEGKPAIIVKRPDKDLLISVGEDVNISFRVQGEPKPKVVFMKGIRDITTSQRVYKMISDDYVQYTLKRSVVSDAGTYCILARNAYGCDRAFVTVVVRQRASSDNLISDWTYPTDDASAPITERNYKSVPDRIPGEPSVVDGGSNWVSLTWPKPEYGVSAPVLAFKIESWLLGKEGGARWVELGITPLNSFDAFNLKQGEEYHFRVTPRNRYGWGESVQTSSPVAVGIAGDRPEFVDILPGQLKVLSGETASLTCSVKGKPTPEVVWMKNGHDIDEESERVSITFNGYNCGLTIKDINIEDEARYSCEATNVHGRTSTYARLAVVSDRMIWEADAKLKRERSSDVDGDYPPQFTMRLRDRRVQATYPVRLTCQVVGCPPPTVTWFKDSQEFEADNRRSKSQDEHFHTLEIAPTTLEDGGVYEALARNSSGAVSCRCCLVVDKGIRAYVAPEFCCGLEPLYRLSDGEELRISAVVEAYPSVGVTWYRDGVRLRPSRRAVMTLDHDGQIELALAAVTFRDAGVYTCTASNEVGHASTSAKVEVIGGEAEMKRPLPVLLSPDVQHFKEPMFIRKPRSSTAREGDTVIIECEVVGDPKPNVYWLRDFLKPDYYRDATHFRRVGHGPEYRFEIPHAKLDYTGTYSVVARNMHGEAKAVISLQILAKDPTSSEEAHNIRYGEVEVLPRFKKELSDLLAYDGDTVEFECRVTGHPEPDIKWFHDHDEFTQKTKDFDWTFENETARLKIHRVTAGDEGTYLCEASNCLGIAKSSACLVVYPPGEPNTLSQRMRRPVSLLSAVSTPRSTPRCTPRSTPARSVSRTRTPGPDTRRLCSPARQIAPAFYTYPFNKVVEEGETVTLQCAVNGLPAPWATWDKDGVIITPSSRFTVKEKDELLRILEIREVTTEDVGVYRITVENELGRAEAFARLEVISQKGKFHGGVRPYSPSPRRSLVYRPRRPSTPRLN